MPRFNSQNHKLFGKITVTPKQWFRRFLKIGDYSIWPYVTMGEIEFALHLERLPEDKRFNVFMRLGDQSYRTIETLKNHNTPIKGTAEYTGDTKFFIAPATYIYKDVQKDIDKIGILLFDDNVLSINHYIFGGVSLIALISTCLCVILAWVLGFIAPGRNLGGL